MSQSRTAIGDDVMHRHGKQRFESAQHTIAAPFLRQLDDGPWQVRRESLEFLLELVEQRERIRGGTRKATQNAPATQKAHLLRVGLHDRLPDSDLAIAAKGDFAILTHRENCGGANPG